MIIFLVGFMGCGKTTLGKQLAAELKYTFIDQDSLIESEEKMSISEIFALKGETVFREIERYVLNKLSRQTNLVVATGGGAPCFYDNAEIMCSRGVSIYLNVSVTELFNRLKAAKAHRPLLNGKSDEELVKFIQSKLTERDHWYKKSTHTITSDNIRTEDILDLLK